MEEFPECSICLDIFGINQSHIKAPKVLKCGDSFCKECLEDIINRDNEAFFLCPLCKQEIKKEESIDDYTTNKEIIRIINGCFNIPQEEVKPEENKVIKYSIASLGNSAVGKTSIFQRLSKDIFSDNYFSTIGMDLTTYYMKYKNQRYKLIFRDTLGQEKFKSIIQSYLKNLDGILFIYDLTDKQSFDDLVFWYDLYKAVNEKIVGLLIGNKCDCQDKRVVVKEEAQKFAKEHNLIYLETSAKLDKNIRKAIKILLEEINESKALYNSISSIGSFNSINSSKNKPIQNIKLEGRKAKKKACC